MEPADTDPHVGVELAWELLRSGPAPIPESDPLLCGREVAVQKLRQLGSHGSGDEGCTEPGPAAEAPPRPGASYRQLPVRKACQLSYTDFVREFMAPNQPVVLRGATAGWRAASEWRTPEGQLELGALEELAGHCHVCVTDTTGQQDYGGEVRSMTLAQYLAWWREHHAGGEGQQQKQGQQQEQEQQPEWQVQEQERGQQQAPGCGQGRLLYLKDWHFTAEFPSYGAYRLPMFFADDWLNHYYDHLAAEAAAAAAAAPATSPHVPAAAGSGTFAYDVAVPPVASAVAKPTATISSTTSPTHLPTTASPLQDHPSYSTPSSSSHTPPPSPAPEPGSPSAPASPSSHPTPAAFTRDYRFVYLGPAGTWTPLHSDVLRSHSWSANVCGRKRWLLLPPQHTHLLYDRTGSRIAPHLEPYRFRSGPQNGEAGREGEGEGEGEEEGWERDFPGLAAARGLAYEFIQETGDAVFVPSGWHHCVENLAPTLSVNHNWLNGHNLHWAWGLLRRQHVDAAGAIQDCRELCDPNEFEALVQQAVGANAGMSWGQLAEMLRVVVGAARKQLATVEAAAAAGTAEEAGTAEGAGQRTGAGCRAEGGVGPGLGGQCGDSDSVCGRAETAAEAEAVGGTESLPAVCGGGQGRQRGVTCPRVVHQLLVLHRAGLVLRDMLGSWEQLVLAAAVREARRRAARGAATEQWSRGLEALRGSALRIGLEELVEDVQISLRQYGVTL